MRENEWGRDRCVKKGKEGKEEKGRSVTSQQVKDLTYRCDLLVRQRKEVKAI